MPALAEQLAGPLGWAWLLGAALLLIALGAALSRWRRRRRVRRRTRRALASEEAAARVLQSAGFAIERRHPILPWPVLIDGALVTVDLRVDYLVTLGDRVFVADAKYGSVATAVRHGPTRRQLLEYLLAYQADGALLVDMNAKQVLEIQFPELLKGVNRDDAS